MAAVAPTRDPQAERLPEEAVLLQAVWGWERHLVVAGPLPAVLVPPSLARPPSPPSPCAPSVLTYSQLPGTGLVSLVLLGDMRAGSHDCVAALVPGLP